VEEAVIISAVRTPIGSYNGALRTVPAYDLGALILNEAIKVANVDPASVDDVIIGQSYQSGEYVNIARMALLKAGWPVEVPGITLDRRCCTGLDAICFAAMKIQTGNADIVVAGGIESMSTAEFYVPGEYMKEGVGGRSDSKWGFMPKAHGFLPMWGIPFFDRIQRARVMSQPIERFGELSSMMTWAETAAKELNISREECDKWSLRSQQRACAATESGKLKEEIVPIVIPQRKGEPLVIDRDEPPRADTSLEKLAKLRPVYQDGVCTAGNSSTENDGAGACVVTTEKKAKELGVEPMGYIKSFALAGADPRRVWKSVTAAVNKALEKAGLTLDEIDLIEMQEAFASQVLADFEELGMKEEDREKVNVNGSGISLGHPISATGALRMVTLLHEMKRCNARYGLETICGGGGLGICAIIERK
jgi:acetyl-CoA C-acetyltransferase